LTGLAGLLGIRTIQHLKQSRLKKGKTLGLRDFVFFVVLGSSFVVAHMMVIGDLHDH
jgi:hypothetical protein